MSTHKCLTFGRTFHVCAALWAASRASPASAHSSQLQSGASLGHQMPVEAAVSKGFPTEGTQFPRPRTLQSSLKEVLPAVRPCLQLSPACSSALPAVGSRGGHPGAGTASPAPLATQTACCPLSPPRRPTWDKLLEKQTSVTQTDLGDHSSTPNTNQQLLWKVLVLCWENRTAELSTAKGERAALKAF